MKNVEFNLLDEPWIQVLDLNCAVQEVSLTDALLHAHKYIGLAGEMPAQDAAMLRLLLAVLHTVFSRVDEDGKEAAISSADDAIMRWNSLWKRGCFPGKPICGYLEQWHEKFWLFHPERPFWQAPEAKIGTRYTAAKLNGEISESGHKIRMFSACAGEGKAQMTYRQAARWLLYINGFDDTSAKPKGKGLPSVGTGWLGKLGLILAQGDTLFETLMLNLVLMRDGDVQWGVPQPCWERPEARSAERTKIPQPDNAAELLTLQSRRLLLHRFEEKVDGYALLGGDFFDRENAFCEQMTLWRRKQERKNDPVVYLPRRHDPAKQFWREFPAVFLPAEGEKQPGLVQWITKLQTTGSLDQKRMIRFQITGVAYGDKDFMATDTFSDDLTFHVQLLSEMGKTWLQKIANEIDLCEKLSETVGYLAKDLEIAKGQFGEKRQQEIVKEAKEAFYFRMDQPFRRWLYAIDPAGEEEDMEECIRSWRDRAEKTARMLGRELIQKAGTAAFTGRLVTFDIGKPTEREIHYSAPEAYNRFLYAVREIYHPQNPENQSNSILIHSP